MIFCDKLGNKMEIGNTVCFISPRYKDLLIGQIVRFTNKTAIVKYFFGGWREVSRRSTQIIRVVTNAEDI